MYHQGYGIIETLAPVHVGASAGEETGNLNLIFRDQFTQTGIIPGSSIRGRFRADMRQRGGDVSKWYGKEAPPKRSTQQNGEGEGEPKNPNPPESAGTSEEQTTEGLVKFEYASIVWIPVYCPNQPIVHVSCPRLLKRYQKMTGQSITSFTPYSYWGETQSKTLFFNLGFVRLGNQSQTLKDCMPKDFQDADDQLFIVVKNTEISMIHDMGLFRQSRVALESDQKKAKKGAFFDVEALPEGTILSFPIALRKEYDGQTIHWEDFVQDSHFKTTKELYFGGLESIGFGRTEVSIKRPSQDN